MSTPSRIEILLLAAGASTRLGRMKQLLPYKGETLLRYLSKQAIASDATRVHVILGFKHAMIEEHLQDLDVRIVRNEQWSNGLSSSIHAGLKTIGQDVDGALLMLCDMPHVTTDHLNTLIQTQTKEQKDIVASRYGRNTGVPALFLRRYFPDLLNIQGDAGAKRIIADHTEDTAVVELAGGEIDIDTEEDRRRYI